MIVRSSWSSARPSGAGIGHQRLPFEHMRLQPEGFDTAAEPVPMSH
jgi:hypothetical protein